MLDPTAASAPCTSTARRAVAPARSAPCPRTQHPLGLPVVHPRCSSPSAIAVSMSLRRGRRRSSAHGPRRLSRFRAFLPAECRATASRRGSEHPTDQFAPCGSSWRPFFSRLGNTVLAARVGHQRAASEAKRRGPQR
jgi:hypothetical protein